MRRSAALPSILLLPFLLAGPVPAAETTRTVRAELSAADAERFAVENLAGSIVVLPGSGPGVVAVATVHAESADLAGTIRIDRVEGEDGRPTLRVIYPLDRHRHFRYPGPGAGSGAGGGFLSRLFRGSGETRTRYAGRRVSVSSGSGVLLYADVEIEVPPKSIDASFRNVAGPVSASRLRGTLTFDTGAGDVGLQSVSGRIRADTGSGDVKVEDAEGRIDVDTGSGDVTAVRVRGSFTCDTGSGDCTIREFSGESIRGDTGSGDITVRSSTAERISVDTGSGSISVVDTDVAQIDADTGSGDIRVSTRGQRLTRVVADTGSGDVSLRLGPGATFEVIADQGSGNLVNRYADAEPILDGREVVGYRRGDARIRISVDTGSGDVLIEPGSES